MFSNRNTPPAERITPIDRLEDRQFLAGNGLRQVLGGGLLGGLVDARDPGLDRAQLAPGLLHATDGHPTADEVFTAVRGHIADISLATVYKALETLVSCGLAKKLPYGDDSSRYDARMDDHFHARCLACGKVRDVGGGSVPRSLPTIEPAEGFRIEGYNLEVVGYCADCAA